MLSIGHKNRGPSFASSRCAHLLMSPRFAHTTWLSAFLALFMVLVLPACWYGAVERARALGQVGPSSANNNEEERHEDEEREVGVVDAFGHPPPQPPTEPAAFVVTTIVTHTPPALVASVALAPEPSLYSVKRLI
jgi:hypothetical protein